MSSSAKATGTLRTRNARLELRVTIEQKRQITRAAAIQGRSVTDFVVTALQDAAKRALDEQHVIQLNQKDSEFFARMLLDPPPVSERMRESVRLYRKATGT